MKNLIIAMGIGVLFLTSCQKEEVGPRKQRTYQQTNDVSLIGSPQNLHSNNEDKPNML